MQNDAFLSADHQNDLDEGSINSAPSSDDESSQSLREQAVDMQADMIERLTTTEQARNMHLFEQLRAWQAEQRELLIRQQQQQLHQLQAEQQAAESRLLVQRQSVWSHSKHVPPSATVSSLPPNPIRKKVQPGLPQAIATSTLALARLRLQESVMINGDLASTVPDEVSEPVVPNLMSSVEERNNVNLERNVGTSPPDLEYETDSPEPMNDSDSDTDIQCRQTDDRSDFEPNHVQHSHLLSDKDFVHKPESGIPVSEYDELPVGSHAAQGRSFEELVLEQLEKERHPSEVHQQPADSVVEKAQIGKSFLRKGEGIARFKTTHHHLNIHKAGGDSRSVKGALPADSNPSRPLEPVPVPVSNAVVQPLCRKLCSKKKIVQNKNSALQSDSSKSDNVEHFGTPFTSTPDRKRRQISTASNKRDSIGDASYLACIQARAKKDEAEVEELQEFELLERYVDDNASFTSNASSISRILAHHDAKQTRTPSDVQQTDSNNEQWVSENDALKMNNEKKVTYTDEDRFDTDDDDDVNSTLVDDAAVVLDAEPGMSSVADAQGVAQPTALQTIYRKISSLNDKISVTEVQSVGDAHQQMLSVCGNVPAISHSQSGFTQNLSDNSVPLTGSQPRYQSVQINSEENGDVEHADVLQNSFTPVGDGRRFNGDIGGNVYSDDREWNDSIVLSPVLVDDGLPSNWHHNSHESSPSTRATTASSSEAQLSVETGYNTADSPPTSRLAQKLFPKLKLTNAKSTQSKSSDHTDALVCHADDATKSNMSAVTSSAVREKLAQLEVEIQQFRAENAVLATLHKEREQIVSRLKKEMAEFERQKADELQHIEKFKAEEIKKLKKERKVFETYQKNARAGADRKDREEIEMLKSQLSEMQDDIKKKEQRWIASNQRLRDRVEQLEQENSELRAEIRVLEQRRLQDWKPRKSDPVPSSKSDVNLLESHPHAEKTAAQPAQLADKIKKQTEQQKNITNGKTSHLEQMSKASAKLNLDVSDETVQQRNNAPKPQASSPNAPLLTASCDDLSALSAARKTAPKSSVVQIVETGDRPYDQVQHPDGKVERVCPDGSREILFTNGTRKQISSDGQTIIVSFFNGDIKQILPDGRVVYYYADAQTTHTTYADGLQIFQFVNGQVEKHYIDGTKEIQFPDQTIKYLFPNGSAESVFLDGTVVHVETNGNKQITFPNGQKEVHTAVFKKREYPDGTTKTVFTDGRQETRYANGRVRVKDAAGVVVLDQLA